MNEYMRIKYLECTDALSETEELLFTLTRTHLRETVQDKRSAIDSAGYTDYINSPPDKMRRVVNAILGLNLNPNQRGNNIE